VVEILAGTAALFAAAWGGAWLSHWDGARRVSSASAASTPTYDDSKGFPRLNQPDLRDPRVPEPRAVEARRAAIRRDAEAIEAECQRAAAGDWPKWQSATEPYRVALKAKVDALHAFPEMINDQIEAQYEPLEGDKGFPLFETGARFYLRYLLDPTALDEFRRNRAVVAASRWLAQNGIDLIFVPLPKMTEVYVEHFLDPCPPDGIIAPHVRRTLLDLLNDDVEVVDGFPLFRALRDTDSEYLYNTATPHWAPRGMRIMAKELAGRIERYRFGARARYALPFWKTSPAAYVFQDHPGGIGSVGWRSMSDERRARAVPAQTTTESHVFMMDGRAPPDNRESPVVVIGNCWVYHFREQLVKELNLLTANLEYDSQTTERFADFLRDPGLLEHCRVVVWITSDHNMSMFARMPDPVMKALGPKQ
jgi:hypothetical protein